MIFSEDSRIKIPCILHLVRLGYRLEKYYIYSPERAVLAPVAKILADRKSTKGTAPGVSSQKYWLQWKAADVLDRLFQSS
jgi:hypothetical protein